MLNNIFKSANNLSWLESKTIFLTLHGSHAYGLNTETSDLDLRGICIPPKQYFLGCNNNFEYFITSNPYDTTVFNIKKFFHLAKDGNPNCLEILFTEPSDHIIINQLGRQLLQHREKFLSRHIRERYIGYAKGQAHRMKNHKRWIDKQLTPPPNREEFGLPKKPSISKDQLLVVQSMIDKKIEEWHCDFEPFSESQKIYLKNKISTTLTEMHIFSDDKWMLAARGLGMNENFILYLQKEKQYQNLSDDYSNYLSWKKNRNPKRAELEAKIGYDAKHATQLIRLLKLGKEILETGQVKVKRTEDKEQLLAIKNCQWSHQQVIDYADQLENEVNAIYHKSPLPETPDYQFLDDLCIQLVEQSIYQEI